MGKFIGRIVTFGFMAALCYAALLVLWGEYVSVAAYKKNLVFRGGVGGFTFTRLQEVRRYADVDVLCLGSSHAYRGFDTRIFRENGFCSFNLGSSSQTPVQTMILLHRFLERLNPQIIIFEVYPEIFGNDGVESALDVIANDKNDLWSLYMAVTLADIRVVNTLIYVWYREIFNRDKDYVESPNSSRDIYVTGGYVERKEMRYKQKAPGCPVRLSFIPRQKAAFEKTVGMIKKKGARLFIVQAPVTKSRRDSYTNHDEIDAYFSSWGTYKNYNEQDFIDTVHFYDPDHLNAKGVRLFNEKIIKDLTSCGGLPERTPR
jgi:hypothetical protein